MHSVISCLPNRHGRLSGPTFLAKHLSSLAATQGQVAKVGQCGVWGEWHKVKANKLRHLDVCMREIPQNGAKLCKWDSFWLGQGQFGLVNAVVLARRAIAWCTYMVGIYRRVTAEEKA